MVGPIRSKAKHQCLACYKPYANKKNLQTHMERIHKDLATNELDRENSVLGMAAREAAEEERIMADMDDDDFEDIVEERRYTKKEKEIAKMIYQRKLKQGDRQKGHLRKSLTKTLAEVAKYKDELVKMTKENNDLRESVKTKESKIKILEKKITPFQCDRCNFKAKEKKYMQSHMLNEHQKCLLCDEHNFNTKTLAIHVKNVHPNSVLVCTKCKLKFHNKTGYEVHNQKKHGHKCKKCSETFSDSVVLKSHVKDKHMVPSVESMFTQEAQLECFICGQKGTTEEELEKHMQDMHIDQVQTLNCVKCKFVEKDSDSMKDHEAGFIHNGIIVPQDEHVNELHIDEVQQHKCKK